MDLGLVTRIRETTLLAAAVVFLALLSSGPSLPTVLSYGAGLGLALVLWASVAYVGTRLGRELSGGQIARVIAAYLGKYLAAGLLIWLLQRTAALDAVTFTVGFSLPIAVVGLKAAGWLLLPRGAQAAPCYSVFRKAG
jgi:hypothetical protein